MKKIAGFVIFSFSLLFLSSAYADTIKLLNGNAIEGKIVEKTNKYVKVQSEEGTLTYYFDEIKSINQHDISFAQASNAKLSKRKSSVKFDIDPEADLESKDLPMGYLDSWYLVGHVTDGVHQFSFFVHYMDVSGISSSSVVSVIDETSGEGKKNVKRLEPAHGNKAKHGIDIQTSNISWTGDMKGMVLTGKIDDETMLNINCQREGPVLPYMGKGYYFFSKNTNLNDEYAFPAMPTTGTVNFEGKIYQVTGECWFDRQWGSIPQDFFPQGRWTWMAMSLSNGNKIMLGDLVYKDEQAWANVLEPDGKITVAKMTPLAKDASNFWQGKVAKKNYPSSWIVRIPDQDVQLNIVSNSKHQETDGAYEGAIKIIGTYKGQSVTGLGFVELMGNQSK